MANTRNLYNKDTTVLKTPELEEASVPTDGFKYDFEEINDIIDQKITLNNIENKAAYYIARGTGGIASDTIGNASISGQVPDNSDNEAARHTIYASVTLDNVHTSFTDTTTVIAVNTTRGDNSTIAATLTQNSQFKIPRITIDSKGRILQSEDITLTLPSNLVNTVNGFAGGITIASGTNISVSDNNNGTITIGTSTDPSFTTVTVTSSEKFKKNIKPFEKNAINLLDSINVVEYNYKCEEDTDIPHIGFVAENTNELFSSKEKDKHRFVDTVGVLIKAVQELNEKIERIEKEIDKCQKK